MMDFKDAQSVIAPFKGSVERIYTVPIPEEPSAFSAEALAEITGNAGEVTPANSVPHALLLSQAAFRRPGRVLFFGSLYLAGHVLALHFNQQSHLASCSEVRPRQMLG
jgi:dihydrofolate synthase/folylpolyglutamate synthase